MESPEPCDVLIVGAGPAGCVLARRLTEDAGCRVALLEAGPDYGSDPAAWAGGVPRSARHRPGFALLGVPRRRPTARSCPRPRGRRSLDDQRLRLAARVGVRLRQVGRARQPRLVLRRPPPVFPPRRGQPRARRAPDSRRPRAGGNPPQSTHDRFFLDYNQQPHFAHQERTDGWHSPATVLGWVRGTWPSARRPRGARARRGAKVAVMLVSSSMTSCTAMTWMNVAKSTSLGSRRRAAGNTTRNPSDECCPILGPSERIYGGRSLFTTASSSSAMG
jgi:choline dehydrogenase-like flavoprotein